MSLAASVSTVSRPLSCSFRSGALPASRLSTARHVRPNTSVRAGQTPDKIDGKNVKKVSDPMSSEFKQRLRDEYTGLGGAPNKPMSQNYFLIISLLVAFLAILTKLTGNI